MRHKMLLVLTLALLALSGLGGLAQAEGEIQCTVTTMYVGITVTPGVADYGVLPWGGSGTVSGFQIENVGTQNADVSVQGSDASGAGASWTMTIGLPGVNLFTHEVITDGTPLKLTTSPVGWKVAWAPGSTQAFETRLGMPSAGSSGAGEVTMSITFVATAS